MVAAWEWTSLSHAAIIGSMEKRTCRACKQTKPLTSFAKASKDPRYRRWKCNACRGKEDYERHGSKRRKYSREYRKRSPARAIVIDTRRSDKRRGLENDLDLSFVEVALVQECFYCGETTHITLDRIDNRQGHLKANVLSACIRCNYTRKDMPYEAWLVVAKGMREAREDGLFGSWTGRARRPKETPPITRHVV